MACPVRRQMLDNARSNDSIPKIPRVIEDIEQYDIRHDSRDFEGIDIGPPGRHTVRPTARFPVVKTVANDAGSFFQDCKKPFLVVRAQRFTYIDIFVIQISVPLTITGNFAPDCNTTSIKCISIPREEIRDHPATAFYLLIYAIKTQIFFTRSASSTNGKNISSPNR